MGFTYSPFCYKVLYRQEEKILYILMTIQDVKNKSIPIFQQYGISYAGIFGSFARGEETNKSDIDFIVKLGKPMGMFKYMKFIDKLESSLKRKVDIVTEGSINKYIKPHIISDIKTIYEN